MSRRWLKLRKRLIGAVLPAFRVISPRLGARILSRLGRFEYHLLPGSRTRFDEAARRWAAHFGTNWDIVEVGRSLAGNEVRWQARDLLLDRLSLVRFRSLVEVEGREHLDRALENHGRVVLLSSHYGSHMIPLHWLLRERYPMRVYMERPNHVSKLLAQHFAEDGPLGQDRLFISRSSSAAESAASILRAVRVLKAGMVLCLAGDVRWSGPNTAAAMFLGHDYSFTATWVVLAAMTSAPVVPVFCRMTPAGTYVLEFRSEFLVPSDVVANREVDGYVRAYLRTVEEELRRDPSNGNEYVGWRTVEARIPPLARAG